MEDDLGGGSTVPCCLGLVLHVDQSGDQQGMLVVISVAHPVSQIRDEGSSSKDIPLPSWPWSDSAL